DLERRDAVAFGAEAQRACIGHEAALPRTLHDRHRVHLLKLRDHRMRDAYCVGDRPEAEGIAVDDMARAALARRPPAGDRPRLRPPFGGGPAPSGGRVSARCGMAMAARSMPLRAAIARMAARRAS